MAASHPLALPAIGVAAALWATNGVVASALFDAGTTPVQLAGARAAITAAGLVLLPAARAAPRARDRAAVVAFGVAIAAVNASYYFAIARLSVAVAIVLQYTGPALVVAWTALRLRQAPGGAVLVALGSALAGVVLVTGLLPRGLGDLDALGVVMGFGAAASFAAYTLLSERVGPVYGPSGALLRGFTVAAALWIAVQIPSGWPSALFGPANIGRVLFVGIAGTLVPFLLYVWAIGHVRAERAVIAATLEPVLAALAAWLWLGEGLSVLQLAGGALVIAAVITIGLSPAARAVRAAPRRAVRS